MITGTLKSQIDAIWNDFWTGGVSNPLTVIEQFTYLMFLKRLDDKQILIEKEINLLGGTNKAPIYTEEQDELRWSRFKQKAPEEMFDLFTRPQKHIDDLTAFDFMRTLGEKGGKFSQYMKGATFMINTPKLLDRVVQQIDKLPLDERDAKGDLYEYMLSKIAEAGTNGQFRTPRHIIRMMVHLTAPQKEDTIFDPAMGTAGFLVESSKYIHENHQDWFLDEKFRKHFEKEMFNGIEIDTSMMRIASMNLQLHGLETPNLIDGSALAESNSLTDEFSLALANPPFKGALDYDEVESSLLTMTKTKKTELLFVALILRMLKVGGRAAVIVPDGVLFGNSSAHKSLRKELVENQQLQGVISMPSGVFKPYAGVSTAILLFTKTNRAETDQVWFFDMKADGYSLDDKRNPLLDEELIEKSFAQPSEAMKEVEGKFDIAQILHDWNHGELNEVGTDRTTNSFLVPKEDIVKNGYDLSINRYKEIIYEKIEYEKPEVLLQQISELDKKRQEAMEELKKSILKV